MAMLKKKQMTCLLSELKPSDMVFALLSINMTML